MKSTILEKFQKGEPCLGTFTHLLSNTGIRVLSRTGLDYAIIDIEHSTVGEGQACELIMAANDAGLCPAVRINEISRGQILKVLDAGKLCIVFCDSAEKANAYFRQGFPNVTMSVDAFMLLNSTKALVETAKDV